MTDQDTELITVADHEHPSPDGPNGEKPAIRDGKGRWTRGNPGGPGNPNGAHYARCTRVLLETVTDEDIARVTRKLVEQACDGNVFAARTVLELSIKKVPVTGASIRVTSDGTVSISVHPEMTPEEWEEFNKAHAKAAALVRRQAIRLPLIPMPGPYPANADGPEPAESIHARAFAEGAAAQRALETEKANDATTTEEESPCPPNLR
jgi:hypothetical protein